MPTSLASWATARGARESSHPPALRYEDVRDRVQDGDVLLFDGRQVLSSLVKRLTNGRYSHCGIVLTWNGRRMLVHADVANGVQATLLSTVLNRTENPGPLWLALSDEARAHVNLDTLRSEAQSHLGMSYDVWGVVHAGAHVFLGTRAPELSDEPRPTHCSAFVARCFRLSGQPLFDLVDNLASPDDISRSLAFVPQGTLDLQNRKTSYPPPPPPLATRIKLMSLELVEKASALLPDALRRGVSSALETEALVREGQAALARSEGEGTRYERVLRSAIDDVVKARLEALRAVDAFRRGDLGLAQALARVQTWNDAGAKVLWQKLENVDAQGELDVAAEE